MRVRSIFPFVVAAALSVTLASPPVAAGLGSSSLQTEPLVEALPHYTTDILDRSSRQDSFDEIEGFAQSTGLTYDEARQSIDLTPEVNELHYRASRVFPATFSGLWRDNDRSGVVIIGFTRDHEESTARLTRHFTRPDLVESRQMKYSLAQLKRDQAALISERQNWNHWNIHGVAIDERSNRVVAYSDDAGMSGRAFEARPTQTHLESRVELVEEARPKVTDCLPDACWFVDPANPQAGVERQRGGLWQYTRQPDGEGLGFCTSAFSATDADGNAGLLTAGHCSSAIGDESFHAFYHNDQLTIGRWGDVVRREFPGFTGSDHAFVRLDGGHRTGPWTWFQYEVRGVWPAAGGTVGSSSCNNGYTQGYRCGQILTRSETVLVGDVELRDVQRNSVCSLPGDSGGSVVGSNQAQGIISAGNFRRDENGEPFCNTAPFTIFSKAANAQATFGVTIDRAP